MNYGMHVAASGVLVNSHRMDVLANNLANVNTPGFKPQFSDVQQRLPERLEDGPFDPEVAQRMLEQLGGGVFASRHQTSFAAGGLVQTGKDLDVALGSADTFFVVQRTDPATGEQGLSLTRNGRFDRNAQGEMVITGTNHRVLDAQDKPIVIPVEASAIRVSAQGEISFSDGAGGNLGGTQFQVARADTSALEHQGGGLYTMTAGDTRALVENPLVHQGAYEGSGTNAIQTMMQIVSATKAATGNANMIRYHDQMLNQSINTFARVS